MLSTSEVRINHFNMEKDYQLITSINNFETLRNTLEENIPKKIVSGKTTHTEAVKESEYFMKSIFNIHKILHVTHDEIDKILPDEEEFSEEHLLEEYNKLGRMVDAYKLPIKITNTDSWSGSIANIVLPFKDTSLLSKEKIMYHYMTLSNKPTRMTGRIISHEITHSQIDSNRGATRYYQNYEVIPEFVELLHNSPDKDSVFFTDILIMVRCHSLLQQINYFQKKLSSKDSVLENHEKDIEWSTYLISTLKAFNLYETYLNLGAKQKQGIIGQVQKVFDGEMTVEELLDKNEISIEKGIESTKRLVKETKRKLQ